MMKKMMMLAVVCCASLLSAQERFVYHVSLVFETMPTYRMLEKLQFVLGYDNVEDFEVLSDQELQEVDSEGNRVYFNYHTTSKNPQDMLLDICELMLSVYDAGNRLLSIVVRRVPPTNYWFWPPR